MTVASARRRSDRDKGRVCACKRRGQVRGKTQPAGRDVCGHERFEPRLENGNHSSAQLFDLLGVGVNADDVVAEIRETHAGHQSDIACANHCETHLLSPLVLNTGLNRIIRPIPADEFRDPLG